MERRSGFTFVGKIPESLGKVTKLSLKDGRIVCETESGVPFICGQNPSKVIEFPHNFGEGEV